MQKRERAMYIILPLFLPSLKEKESYAIFHVHEVHIHKCNQHRECEILEDANNNAHNRKEHWSA